jgi:hypothetical protein
MKALSKRLERLEVVARAAEEMPKLIVMTIDGAAPASVIGITTGVLDEPIDRLPGESIADLEERGAAIARARLPAGAVPVLLHRYAHP